MPNRGFRIAEAKRDNLPRDGWIAMIRKARFATSHRTPPGAGPVAATLVALGWALAGCPSFEHEITSVKAYTPPSDYAVPGRTTVEADFETTWRQLEQGADTAPFRLTVSQKQSRFAVVELDVEASGRAIADFADCGRLERQVVQDGESTTFSYALVETARDRVVIPEDDHFEIRDLERRPRLTIRTTVFLRPGAPGRTGVTLNTRYALRVDSSGERRQLPRRRGTEAPPPEPFGPERLEIHFTSFEEGFAPGTDELRCRATGAVEDWLLSMIRGDKP
jgi:hypothetical protein